jgi:hypothetical protein
MFRHLDVTAWALVGLLLVAAIAGVLWPLTPNHSQQHLILTAMGAVVLATLLGFTRYRLGCSGRRAALAAVTPPLTVAGPTALVPEL